MDTLPSYFLNIPAPCAVLAVYKESQAQLRDHVLQSGRINSSNNQDRLHIIVSAGAKVVDPARSDECQWDQGLPEDADWPWLQRNVPPCLVCVRDWQHYTIDDLSSNYGSESPTNKSESSTPSRKEASAQASGNDSDQDKDSPKEICGSMKHLTDLIREDVEQCLVAYRKNLLEKKPVPGKIMFMILLKEGIKNPHKAVNGLKHLNPSEVAAICVTSGSEDISTKVCKLEQLMYDVCVSYYEKRISILTKQVYKMKTNLTYTPDESLEINCAIQSFKLGYFNQFVGHIKESIQALSQAWELVVPCAIRNPTEDYVTLALYIALDIIKVRFVASNLLEALTFAFEALSFFRNVLRDGDKEMLYNNVAYILQHAVAIHLDRAGEYKELKGNNHIRQHAVNFYKWTIQHMLKLRTLIMRSKVDYQIPRRFANLLLKDDDDFKGIYKEDALSSCKDPNERIRNLESLTERMLVQLIDVLSTCSWYNTLFQVTEMLGDSLLLSSKPREAYCVYSNIGECLINSTAIDTDYILRSCSSEVIVEEFKKTQASRTSVHVEPMPEDDSLAILPNFMKSSTNMLVAEQINSKGWWALYQRLLCKMILSLGMVVNKLSVLPDSICHRSCLPVDLYKNMKPEVSFSGLHEEDKDSGIREMSHREYILILFKSLLTLCSVAGGDFDLTSVYRQLFSELPTKSSIECPVLLSKHHKGQYMLGKAEMGGNTIATRLQVLVNFHVDLPFAIDVTYVTICTSIGTFYFEILETVSNDDHLEIYTGHRNVDMDGHSDKGIKSQDEDAAKAPWKAVTLEGNSNVFLAITCPPVNNKFMVDSFKLLGLKLVWVKAMEDGTLVNISCMVPFLTPYVRLGTCYAEQSLFTADIYNKKFCVNEQFYTFGATTSMMKTEEMLHKTMTTYSAESNPLLETIVELMDTGTHNTDMKDSLSTEMASCSEYESDACRMFVNRIYFKVFIGTMVEGHVSPVTCVLLYNKQILAAQNLEQVRFSVEITSTASSFLFYALCIDKEEGGKLKQCVNNKFTFTLTDFADVQHLDLDLRLDSRSSSDSDTVVPALFVDSEGPRCSINSEMDAFLELAQRDANVGIVYIHGLLKVLSHGFTNVQFNLQMQPMHGNTLKEMESNFLVVKDVTEAWVHEPIQMQLSTDIQYDNNRTNFLRFLTISLTNGTDVQYNIDHIKVLYEEQQIAGRITRSKYILSSANKDLLGFCKELEKTQSLQFMYLFPPEVKTNNSVEVQCTHYIIHPSVFPFDRMQQCFHSARTKSVQLTNEHEATDIAITLKHDSNVELGFPFEMVAEIKNMTTHTLDYHITLPNAAGNRHTFLITGPRIHEVNALPKEVSTLKWSLIATRCGHHELPSVKLTQRRKVLLRKEQYESTPTKVYVYPKKMGKTEFTSAH